MAWTDAWTVAGRPTAHGRAAADDGRATARRRVRRAAAHDRSRAAAHDRSRAATAAGARASGTATGDRPHAYSGLDPGLLRRRAPPEPTGGCDHDVAGPGVAHRP